ncbi:MAG TPA: RidA family protein [Burkholderiales bacterium]|nr:RidA family protein [Burkholderiales bacterium]
MGKIDYLEGSEHQKSRAFSPAVTTEGGKTVWLAGQTTLVDEEGASIAGDCSAQARTIFALMEKTLRRCGGTLANLVTMTVFINDPRYADEFVKVRGQTFKDGRYPASALITVSGFSRPGIVIEIQGVAVV